MPLLQGALLLLVVASCAYHLLAWLLTRHFAASLRPSPRAATEPAQSGALAAVRPRLWPAVTQIKPLHRVDGELRDCLASFLGQDYPGPVEVLLVARPATPGLEELERCLRRDLPRRALRLVTGERPGSNRKIASCALAMEQGTRDLVVLSDADMRVAPDYLQRVVQGFVDPRVGMVTCLYAVQRATGLGAALEGLSVADFAASVLVARRVEGLSFGLGATMAVRREALEQVGGLEALRDYLADDYQLGNRIATAGWRVALAPVVVEDVVGRVPFGEYFSHQLRWMRTYRISRPAGHVAFLVTQGLPWSVGFLAATGFRATGWAVLGGWLALRVLTAVSCWRLLAGTPAARWGLLAPLKDLLYLVLWVLSLGGTTVRWGDQVFRLRRDGRMEPLAHAVEPGVVAPPTEEQAAG